MEEWLSEGTEIRDLAEEVNMASYYPAGYIPYAYTTATTSTSVADGGGLFSPVRGAQMKAGKGVVFRGRQGECALMRVLVCTQCFTCVFVCDCRAREPSVHNIRWCHAESGVCLRSCGCVVVVALPVLSLLLLLLLCMYSAHQNLPILAAIQLVVVV